MNLPLNQDCRSHVFRALPLADLRSARLVCRAFRDEAQEPYWQASLQDQFQHPPKVPAGAKHRDAFIAAFKGSAAATRGYVKPHDPRKVDWIAAEKEASAWAVDHRLAVADAFWSSAEERLRMPRITLQDVLPQIDRLLAILPGGAPSPVYGKALAVLLTRYDANALSRLAGQEKKHAAVLRATLLCGQALSSPSAL